LVRARLTDMAFILELTGELTLQSETALLGTSNWQQGLNDGRRSLILDFQKVTYISSGGISVLMRLIREYRAERMQIFAFGLCTSYERLLRLVGFTQHVMVYPDGYAIEQRLNREVCRRKMVSAEVFV
jgi:anti-anti-sigma factor